MPSLTWSTFVASVVFAAAGWWIGKRRGRPLLGFALGYVLWFVGYVILLAIPSRSPARPRALT